MAVILGSFKLCNETSLNTGVVGEVRGTILVFTQK